MVNCKCVGTFVEKKLDDTLVRQYRRFVKRCHSPGTSRIHVGSNSKESSDEVTVTNGT